MAFYHIRFPKNNDLAIKWNEALGLSGIKNGMVCQNHFNANEFKRRHGEIVGPGKFAIPIIYTVSSEQNVKAVQQDILEDPIQVLTQAIDKSFIFSNDSNEAVETFEQSEQRECHNAVDHNNICQECLLKDEMLRKNQIQIEKLKSDLKSMRNKVDYLKSTRLELNATLKKLQEEKLVDEKLITALEVCTFHIQFKEINQIHLISTETTIAIKKTYNIFMNICFRQ